MNKKNLLLCSLSAALVFTTGSIFSVNNESVNAAELKAGATDVVNNQDNSFGSFFDKAYAKWTNNCAQDADAAWRVQYKASEQQAWEDARFEKWQDNRIVFKDQSLYRDGFNGKMNAGVGRSILWKTKTAGYYKLVIKNNGTLNLVGDSNNPSKAFVEVTNGSTVTLRKDVDKAGQTVLHNYDTTMYYMNENDTFRFGFNNAEVRGRGFTFDVVSSADLVANARHKLSLNQDNVSAATLQQAITALEDAAKLENNAEAVNNAITALDAAMTKFDETYVEKTPNKNHMLTASLSASRAEHQVFTLDKLNDGIINDRYDGTNHARWSSENVTNQNRGSVFIKAEFKYPTMVQKVVLDNYRKDNPSPSSIRSFKITYTDDQNKAVTLDVNCTEHGNTDAGMAYVDDTVVTFKQPVLMKTIKFHDFYLTENVYKNVSYEEIQVFSNDDTRTEFSKLIDSTKQALTSENFTAETKQAVQTAVDAAVAKNDGNATGMVIEAVKNEMMTLRRALNNATRLYNVDVLVNGTKDTDMSFKQVYNQAKPNTTISAPSQSDKGNFVGWFKKQGDKYLYRVTDANTTSLDVVASNDVTYEAVYGAAPQHSSEAGIEMQNSFVSKVGEKYSAKFVGKYFNLPKEATDVKFGLKWGKNANNLTPVQFNSPANKYQQFSLTVNGLTEGQSVTGQVYVTYTLNGQPVELVSEKVTLYI